ncbi:MAG TPA: molecular chaperone DnaJ [Deltaproteobacteria bacterium]|nr:molecular chaperone DnaJ [Deltaproteobacteria bacterium]
MNPYEVLGIGVDADDVSVRNAYLDLVRRYPPERHPEKFKQITEAYARLKDKKSRLEYYLFNRETPYRSPFEVLISYFSEADERRPPNFEEIKEYLRRCATQ